MMMDLCLYVFGTYLWSIIAVLGGNVDRMVAGKVVCAQITLSLVVNLYKYGYNGIYM